MMMHQDNVPLTVKILGREYQVACPMDERDHLLASARYLDDRMQAIRKRAAGLGVERIAVMTALNMAREMLAQEQNRESPVVVSLTGKSAAAPPARSDDSDSEDDRAHQLRLRIESELQAK